MQQRILEVERVLVEVVGPLEPTDNENRRRKRQLRQQEGDGRDRDGEDDDGHMEDEAGLSRESVDEAGTAGADTNSQASPTTVDDSKEQEGDNTGAEAKGGDDIAGGDGNVEGEAGDDGKAGANGAAEGKEDESGQRMLDDNKAEAKGRGGGGGSESQDTAGVGGGAGGGDGSGEPAEDVLAQVGVDEQRSLHSCVEKTLA